VESKRVALYVGEVSSLRSGHIVLSPEVEQSPAANNPYEQTSSYYPADTQHAEDTSEHHPQYGKDGE